ncbi:MAG: diacylglycerol kinase family protein [Acidimicrobiia bacterium]|nr:diacylglycerol kinase family protein [Acidimicrobiia bacterium]
MATAVTLLVNPFASSVTARTRIAIQRRLSECFDLTVIDTTKSGHAIRLAHGASRSGADVVIGFGGDGTINEVANGLLGSSTAAAPLPGGSTNVFARALGFPNDPVAATEVLVEAIEQQSVTPAGVGMAADRAFLFHSGIGFDAAVVERVEQRGTVKRYAGHPFFVAITVDTWLRRIDRSRPWFSIEDQEGNDFGTFHMAVALNCSPYTFLGDRPLDLAPEAGLDAPLSLVGLRSMSLPGLVGAARQALGGSGGIGNSRTTGHWSGLDAVTVIGHRPFPYQLDGESCGWLDRLEIRHLPNALRVVVPAKPNASI